MTIVDEHGRLFFDYFLTISKFSFFWTVQEGPGRLLGGVLGGSWGCPGGFGGSWGCPGGSGERLGRVLGGLGAILERLFEQSDFGSIF